AQAILASVGEVLSSDEHAKPLGAALSELRSKVLRLITAKQSESEPTPDPPVVKPWPPTTQPGRRLVEQGTEDFAEIAVARDKLEKLSQLAADGRHVRLTIAWRIEED